uniref:Uncharacterized protein n=1 Tax=Prymnesium polylepis TaxID=72548 RepID=A0A7S4IHL4_9EUKA
MPCAAPTRICVRLEEVCVALPGVDHVFAGSHVVLAWTATPPPFVWVSSRRQTQPFVVTETLILPQSYIDRRASTVQDLLLVGAQYVYLVVLHRRNGRARLRTLAHTRFCLAAYSEADHERVDLALLRGRLRLSFRATAMAMSDTDVLAPLERSMPLARTRRRETDQGFTRLLPTDNGADDTQQRAASGSNGKRLSPPRIEAQPSHGLLQEDRLSALYAQLAQLRAARSRRKRAEGAARSPGGSGRRSRGAEEIERLQLELNVREQERANTEERLATAYGAVVRDLQRKVNQLTAERDELVLAIEGVRGGLIRSRLCSDII